MASTTLIPYRKVNITRMNRNTWMLLFHNCTTAEAKGVLDDVQADPVIDGLPLDYSTYQQMSAETIATIQVVILQSSTTIPPIVRDLIIKNLNEVIAASYGS